MSADPSSTHTPQNDNVKSGALPRPKIESKKDQDVSRSPHTQADPQSGKPNPGRK